jgi:uncharacterized membrane protein
MLPSAAKLRTYLWLDLALLVLLQLLWHTIWLPPKELAMPIALCFALVPLAPGVVLYFYKHPLAIVFAGLGVLLHLIYGLMETVLHGPNRVPALVQVFLCGGFFVLWLQVIVLEKRAKNAGV